MGLKEVEQDILRKGEAEVKAIILEGQREADTIIADAKEKVKEYQKKAEDSTSQLLSQMERREKAAAEFEVKKNILDAKKALIEEAAQKTRESLEALPQKERDRHISSLLSRAGEEIKVQTVYANSRDRHAVEANDTICYKKGDMNGGLIAETEEGDVRVDYTYEEILQDLKEKSLQHLGGILF
ncbi:hypothetical protein HYS47_00400 [Candidatus Woesearchaeota archaeon]|nr:hypothetical protein [Candidatus Woesearchaeota archaeon]